MMRRVSKVAIPDPSKMAASNGHPIPMAIFDTRRIIILVLWIAAAFPNALHLRIVCLAWCRCERHAP